MTLGAFSVSLSVKDLTASKTFYGELGFAPGGGEADQGWLILSDGDCTIGLFQGMFEKNTLTFNPGWDRNAQPLDGFEDVRDVQRRLRKAGIEPVTAADETTTGPTSLVLMDPDGNPVLIDQHV